MVSAAAPPSSVSSPVPPTRLSAPSPPSSSSSPASPTSVSAPSAPSSTSLPKLPTRLSVPAPPISVSSPAPPSAWSARVASPASRMSVPAPASNTTVVTVVVDVADGQQIGAVAAAHADAFHFADVDGTRTEIGGSDQRVAAARPDAEAVIAVGPVDLGGIRIGAADDSIGPVADGPDEPVRRVAAVQQIVAMHPDKDVG